MIFVPFLREPRKIDFLSAGFPQRLSPSPQIYRGILVIPIPVHISTPVAPMQFTKQESKSYTS